MQFANGELVECIDNNGVERLLTLGKTYKVASYPLTHHEEEDPQPYRIHVDADNGIPYYCFAHRFRPLEEDV